MNRQLIIGDIHGCYDELQDLLDKSGIGDGDEIIALGDLFDRGPKPKKVLRFFRKTQQARSIRGNHEEKHLQLKAKTRQPTFSQLYTRYQLKGKYKKALKLMTKLPLYLELDDAILIHGFLEPNIPLKKQKRDVLLGTMPNDLRLQREYKKPWYAYYDGKKPLIVGHRDYGRTSTPTIYKDKVYAIDSGCVYGGSLTGLLLPEFKIVTVPARADYWSQAKMRYREFG